jgi:hypothetical protein
MNCIHIHMDIFNIFNSIMLCYDSDWFSFLCGKLKASNKFVYIHDRFTFFPNPIPGYSAYYHRILKSHLVSQLSLLIILRLFFSPYISKFLYILNDNTRCGLFCFLC